MKKVYMDISAARGKKSKRCGERTGRREVGVREERGEVTESGTKPIRQSFQS